MSEAEILYLESLINVLRRDPYQDHGEQINRLIVWYESSGRAYIPRMEERVCDYAAPSLASPKCETVREENGDAAVCVFGDISTNFKNM